MAEGWGGTLTAMSSASPGAVGYTDYRSPASTHLYLRLIWTAANTFAVNHSWDGVTWIDSSSSTISDTLTPTHFGVSVSTWGGSTVAYAQFEYVRVYESDLSV